MQKRIALAILLTLFPLFTGVTSVKATTYYSLFDIFKYFASLKTPATPTFNINATLTPTRAPTRAGTTPLLSPSPTPLLSPAVTITLVVTTTPTPTPTNEVTSTPTPSSTSSPKQTLYPSPTRSVLGVSDDSIKNFLMSEINTYRKSHGLYEVKPDPFTCDFAKVRAREISTNFNHNGFTDRINTKSLPYPSYSKITENIAMNSNYLKVVTQWINSTGHAANMRADTPFVCVEKYGNYYAYLGWKP